MGFGLLFLGYFATFLMSYALPVQSIGCAIMACGTVKLSEYNPKFKLCLAPSVLLGFVGLYMLVYGICDHFDVAQTICSEGVLSMMLGIQEALNAAFHVCLLTAICSIAKETELPKWAYKSMLIVLVGTVLYMVSIFLPDGTSVTNVLGNVSIIVKLIWVLLNVWLIANCYRLICDENDEDMNAKESKIPIIRKMDAVINKREEEAMQSGREMAQKRQERKREKRKGNKKKR